MIETIFWDFDGVLAESVQVKTEAFRDLYLPYGEEVAGKVVEHHLAHGGMSRYEKFPHYHREFLGKDLKDEEAKDLASQFRDLVLRKVVDAPEVRGATEFLESSSSAFGNYVVSGTPHDEIQVIVKERGLGQYFQGVYGSPRDKTSWSAEVVRKNSLVASRCVFIGDARSDYKAAQNNGFHFILRETEDNKDLFSEVDCPRVSDLSDLNRVLEVL